MVTVEAATVYRGGNRRWLTLNAAVKAEAIKLIKKKYPTERAHYCDGYVEEPGSHWHDLPRSDVLLRRMSRLVRAAAEIGRNIAQGDGGGV